MKKKVLLLSIIGIVLVGITISFAYWQIILSQESTNLVNSDCFEIEFLSGEEITLNHVYPMSDGEGISLSPYSFKITNQCDSYATYQINLETLPHDNKELPEKYLKVNLSEKEETKITSKLTSELEVEPTFEDATSAYKLNTGVLRPQEEKEFTMHLWMHSDVTASDLDSMNATYQGKVSIVASYINPSMMILDELVPLVSEGSGLYEVNHEDASITYTEDVEAQNRLKQTEYRYAGSNPNNYVRFNNELWRIIGLANTPEGQRVKIIRDESIGEYSWDSSVSSINDGQGINEWSQADLMYLLNEGPYYQRSSGICYNGQNNATTSCDFSEIGLLPKSKEMIDTITWNTSTNDGVVYKYNNMNVYHFYNQERSHTAEKICSGIHCNDNVIRTIMWKGNVGLMYPSDYGYATSGGNITSRNTCFQTMLYTWNNDQVSDCMNNNWLYEVDKQKRTIMPCAYSGDARNVFGIYYDSFVTSDSSYIANDIYPALYLKSNIKIVSGDGTIDSPYEFSESIYQ